MRMRWKLVGLAGLAGVTATGVVVARKGRAQREYQPDELRERLHRRLAEASPDHLQPAAPSDQAVRPSLPGGDEAAPDRGGGL
jgi:hypothetical protein